MSLLALVGRTSDKMKGIWAHQQLCTSDMQIQVNYIVQILRWVYGENSQESAVEFCRF